MSNLEKNKKELLEFAEKQRTMQKDRVASQMFMGLLSLIGIVAVILYVIFTKYLP